MKKFTLVLALGLALVFGLAMQASAHTISKIGDAASDGNYLITKDEGANHATVFEDYNAQSLVAFTPPVLPSGATSVNAVVDFNSAGDPIYFTKALVLDEADTPGSHAPPFSWESNFHITNTSPYTWTNYEFIITNLPSGVILDTADNSNQLKGKFQDATHLEFYATDATQFVAPGELLNLNFKLAIDHKILPGETVEIDFMQVATTNVPLPPSAYLLGSGLLGLLGWRRKARA